MTDKQTFQWWIDHANQLENDVDLWRDAAETLMGFIREHMCIVGYDEISGFAMCKKKFAKALRDG